MLEGLMDNDRHIRLIAGQQGRTRCVACGLCAAHCPVQCIRVDWKQGRLPGRMDPLNAPVQVHLGKPVLLAPRHDPPQRSLLEKDQGRIPDRVSVHLGRLVPAGRPVLSPARERRSPTTFHLDHDKCIRCGLCIALCPVTALEFAEGPGSDDLLRAFQDRQQPTREDTKGVRP